MHLGVPRTTRVRVLHHSPVCNKLLQADRPMLLYAPSGDCHVGLGGRFLWSCTLPSPRRSASNGQTAKDDGDPLTSRLPEVCARVARLSSAVVSSRSWGSVWFSTMLASHALRSEWRSAVHACLFWKSDQSTVCISGPTLTHSFS